MNFKNLILGIAIFILTIAVGVYGIITLFGDSPRYEKYCPMINNEQECISFGGKWTGNTDVPIANPIPEKAIPGYCDIYEVCNPKLENAQESYGKKIFFSALPLGIIIIIIGALVFGLESVGAGLMAGGVGIIIYGITGIWRFADNWIKFLLTLIGLIVLIYLAYYFNKKLNKKRR